MKINSNFDLLVPNYLFADVARKTNEFAAANPDKEIIRLGIGDVTLPIAPIVVASMKKGCEDLRHKETFKGYPEYEGYDFVREAVSGYYKSYGVDVGADEIFISDGAKSDCGNLGDIFSQDNIVLVTDPVYPVYVDANLMAGRKINYAAATQENHFLAMPDENVKADIIYLCSPGNPTGAAYSAEQLKIWVDYANKNGAVIIYDAAYEAFIKDDSPRSIFCIEGARTCAIELCSLSKTAGFTGTRCGYTVIPKVLSIGTPAGERLKLGPLWEFRQGCKFNGASYVAQRGAAAIYTEEGRLQTRQVTDYYLGTAGIIREGLQRAGLSASGGENAPYVWTQTPGGMDDWEFFDRLLAATGIVITPGSGFGEEGKGHFRITSFGDRRRTEEAMKRLKHFVDGL